MPCLQIFLVILCHKSRYIENILKVGNFHLIEKIIDMGQSSILKSDVPYCYTYIPAPLRFTKMGVRCV